MGSVLEIQEVLLETIELWKCGVQTIAVLHGADLRSGRLRARVAGGHGEEVTVDGEAGIDQGNEDGHDVTHVDGLGLVPLWDVHGWCWHHLLPAEAHVSAENDDCAEVEEHPAQGLEHLELHPVDVSDIGGLAALVADPEKVQAKLQKGLQVQQVRWRAQFVRLGLTESELEKVDHHEGQQSDT